ncbi:MAG: response regulator [Campylobacteraceae bacterium]|jgi:DNA-binding NtrC family response regulator|nr:response regulator [Campylobacteraceae bacterium]
MKILIVENEVYLAQSISTKLTEVGYTCEIVTNIKDALKNEKYDAVLLSTNISGQNFYPIIEKHKNSIIVLMISYISSDTILNPIKAGASDYIQKPFMMEELLRKLQHLRMHNKLLVENKVYSSYMENLFANIEVDHQIITKKITSPILIKSAIQTHADALAFRYAKDFKEQFNFISLSNANALEKIAKNDFNTLMYLVNLQDIKTGDKNKIFNVIEQKRVIISSTNLNEESPFESIKTTSDDNFFEKLDILTIDDYVKNVLTHFQGKLPDTELSKKLGISRKSLWERRKKYGIKKK